MLGAQEKPGKASGLMEDSGDGGGGGGDGGCGGWPHRVLLHKGC